MGEQPGRPPVTELDSESSVTLQGEVESEVIAGKDLDDHACYPNPLYLQIPKHDA